MKKILILGLMVCSLFAAIKDKKQETLKQKIEKKKAKEYGKISLGFKSFHYRTPTLKYGEERHKQKMNENNFGFFYHASNNLMIGYVHKNTYNDGSIIIGYWDKLYKYKDVEIEYFASLASGYSGAFKQDGRTYSKDTNKYTIADMLPYVGVKLDYKYITLAITPFASYLGATYKF